MEKSNVPVFTSDDAKEFHNTIHDYEIVDGNPLTIGHALKDLPTKTFSHGRIYDVEHLNVNANLSVGSNTQTSKSVNGTTKPYVTDNNFSNVSSQINLSRCDGEVMTWAHAHRYLNTGIENGQSHSETIKDGFNTQFSLHTLVNVPKSQGSSGVFGMGQIQGKPAQYVCENVYPVDPDVVQDL